MTARIDQDIRSVAKGKVQEEELDSCRAAGERGPATRRDEGPRETEGVFPGAICTACQETKRPRTNPGPQSMKLGRFLLGRLFLCRSLGRCWLRLVGTLCLRFDSLGLLWREHLLGLCKQVRLALLRNTDVV